MLPVAVFATGCSMGGAVDQQSFAIREGVSDVIVVDAGEGGPVERDGVGSPAERVFADPGEYSADRRFRHTAEYRAVAMRGIHVTECGRLMLKSENIREYVQAGQVVHARVVGRPTWVRERIANRGMFAFGLVRDWLTIRLEIIGPIGNAPYRANQIVEASWLARQDHLGPNDVVWIDEDLRRSHPISFSPDSPPNTEGLFVLWNSVSRQGLQIFDAYSVRNNRLDEACAGARSQELITQLNNAL